MARHKDINHTHALLEGEGWHIEDRTVHLNKSTTADGTSGNVCIIYVCRKGVLLQMKSVRVHHGVKIIKYDQICVTAASMSSMI